MKYFGIKLLFCMRRNCENRYSRRMRFIFDSNQLDLLPSITGSFVSALNGDKKKKKNILTISTDWFLYNGNIDR